MHLVIYMCCDHKHTYVCPYVCGHNTCFWRSRDHLRNGEKKNSQYTNFAEYIIAYPSES